MPSLKKLFILDNVFISYFWLCVLDALFVLQFHSRWLLRFGFSLILYVVFFKKVKRVSLNFYDLLWIICFIWAILTWTHNDYPQKADLIVYCCIMEVSYMLAYWIGRCETKNYLDLIVKKAIKPLIITSIIGIYCFFFRPSWYIKIIYNSVDDAKLMNTVDEQLLDAFRLRSIFDSPYTLSYMGSIVLILLFFNLFSKKDFIIGSLWKQWGIIVLLLLTLTLCMMRAPILSAVIGFVIACFYGLVYYRKGHSKRMIIISLFMLFILVSLFLKQANSSTVSALSSKSEEMFDDNNDFIENRLFLHQQSFTLFGEGFGRYSTVAYYKYNLPCVADGEYMKILAEQGQIGLFLLLLLLSFGLLKSARNFRFLYFEFCIMIMLMICMIGANPLSTPDKHCFLYWMALGKISSYAKKNKYKLIS